MPQAVVLEARLARVEGILEAVRTRLNHLEERTDANLREVRQGIARLEARQDSFLRAMLAV